MITADNKLEKFAEFRNYEEIFNARARAVSELKESFKYDRSHEVRTALMKAKQALIDWMAENSDIRQEMNNHLDAYWQWVWNDRILNLGLIPTVGRENIEVEVEIEGE